MFFLSVNSFSASLPRVEGDEVLFLFFSFAVSSTMVTPLLDHVVRYRQSIQSELIELFCWIRFQPRSVRKSSWSLLDSKGEDIENIALLVLFRITRIIPHCPFHGPSLSNCYWMGCRRYFAAKRLEVLLNENDSRSSSRALERGSFLRVSKLHVAILTLWSQCLFPRALWSNRWIVYFSQVSPCLFDLHLRFRLCLQIQQTLAHNSLQNSPLLKIGFSISVGFVGSLHHLQQLQNPFFWASLMSTQYTVFWFFFQTFCLYHARRGASRSIISRSLCSLSTRFTSRKNTVCLLLKLSSRYQSWIRVGEHIDCTSDVINVIKENVRN